MLQIYWDELYDHKHSQKKLGELLKLGGFPEPLLSGSEEFVGRWRLAYGKRLVREDVRTLEQTQELDQMELLFERLPDLICNNLSINKLAKDLEVSHQTVSKWLQIFERLYGCFFVLPWGDPKIKAVKKEKKLYLWDWAFIEDPGARLENLVAVHLLRLVHWFEDIYGEVLDLRYFRDPEGHEVDFIILRKKQPWIAIEVKSSEQEISTSYKYFLNRVQMPFAYQIHLKSDVDSRLPNINQSRVRIMPVAKFLQLLP
jgi:predicted AAA+ superfamily ATPase